MYRYYLTKRPISIGTQPKGFINYKDFDYKMFIPEIDCKAYGYVEYIEPLTLEQIKKYELIEG